MREERLIPRRRFREFEDSNAWEKYKLSEVSEFNPKGNLPDTFKYIDLESVVGTKMIHYREEKKEKAPSRAQRLARKGDLFYQTVRPYQKNNYLFEKTCNNYVFSTGYTQIRPYIDGYFLLNLVQTNLFVETVLDRCTGTSYPAINSNDLADIETFIPDNNEQAKIGGFFKNLDNLITLQQNKLKKMKDLKSAYLSEMFPKEGEKYPKRRFAGFDEPWEECKLGELGSVAMNKRIFKDQTTEVGDVPFYKIGTFGKKPDAYIARGLFEEYKTKYAYPKVGDILISASGSIGRTVEYSGKDEYFQDSNIVWLEHGGKIDNLFLKQFYKIVQWEGLEGSTIKRLYNKNILETEIILPSLAEQDKVGTFFNNLDNLITHHQNKLDKLQNLKKAYLSEMFV